MPSAQLITGRSSGRIQAVSFIDDNIAQPLLQPLIIHILNAARLHVCMGWWCNANSAPVSFRDKATENGASLPPISTSSSKDNWLRIRRVFVGVVVVNMKIVVRRDGRLARQGTQFKFTISENPIIIRLRCLMSTSFDDSRFRGSYCDGGTGDEKYNSDRCVQCKHNNVSILLMMANRNSNSRKHLMQLRG